MYIRLSGQLSHMNANCMLSKSPTPLSPEHLVLQCLPGCSLYRSQSARPRPYHQPVQCVHATPHEGTPSGIELTVCCSSHIHDTCETVMKPGRRESTVLPHLKQCCQVLSRSLVPRVILSHEHLRKQNVWGQSKAHQTTSTGCLSGAGTEDASWRTSAMKGR